MSHKTLSAALTVVVPVVLAWTMLGGGFAMISIILSFAIAEGMHR